MDHEQPPPSVVRYSRRALWTSLACTVLLVLIGGAQWLRWEQDQAVRAALRTLPTVGKPDYTYAGMAFSAEHVLVATFKLEGFVDATAARWHAKPWGHVVVEKAGAVEK